MWYLCVSQNSFVDPKLQNMSLGVMDISTTSENHGNEDFSVFWKVTSKVSNPKWGRIVLQSFWATLLLQFIITMTPQTPPRPQLRIFAHILLVDCLLLIHEKPTRAFKSSISFCASTDSRLRGGGGYHPRPPHTHPQIFCRPPGAPWISFRLRIKLKTQLNGRPASRQKMLGVWGWGAGASHVTGPVWEQARVRPPRF